MKKLFRILKYLFFALVFYSFLAIITPFCKPLKNKSIKNQIHYLADKLDAGYDDELQDRFPEGKIFSNAFLALSIIEFANNDKASADYAKIVDDCAVRLLSSDAKANFNKHMETSYGVFYNGWTSLVLYSYINSELFNLSQIKDRVIKEQLTCSSRIENALSDSLQLLDAYVNASWPADNGIASISLNNHKLKQDWIQWMLDYSEHPAGLIPHASSKAQIVRGSSSAMLLYVLKLSEYDDIQDYNKVFNDLFVDEYLGVQLVKPA